MEQTASFLKETPDCLLILVRVQPNASKNALMGEIDTGQQVNGFGNKALKIKLKSPAYDNKANKELISFLSKRLSIPPSQIKIKSGSKSRLKILCINSLSTNEALQKLKETP